MKYPDKIPPIIITIRNRLGIASQIVFNTTFDVRCSLLTTYPCFFPYTKATIIHNNAHKSPGIQPAISNAATETPPLAAENTINEAVGGINCPTGADATLAAAENALSYPCSSSSGCITPPIAVAAAIPEPDIEPNIALPAILVMAKEPGTLPNTSIARLISLLAIPPLLISKPASIKNGTASNVKLSIPVTIF